MDPYKQIVSEFLTEDFVDNYAYHKECLDQINFDLQENNIPFNYTYDVYCKELLKQFLLVVENYFATKETAADFFDSYNDIVANTFEQLKKSKARELRESE